MRRRQSMQVLELERQVDQLMAENQALNDARIESERNLSGKAASALSERDLEIDKLKKSLAFLQKEVGRLTEVNEGLSSASGQLAIQHNERYHRLEMQHEASARELEASRAAAARLEAALDDKSNELEASRSATATLEDVLNGKNRDLEMSLATAAELENSLKDKNHEVEESRSIATRLRSSLEEKDLEIEASRSATAELENSLSDKDRQIEASLAAAEKLESALDDQALEIEDSRAAAATLEKTLQEKDQEIERLRAELEATKEQIRDMQEQILAAERVGSAQFLRIKDVDYFDNRCQQLCSHIQQWVLRFSKFSDLRSCRLSNELHDEKLVDRLDNTVLDGTDVDDYLTDRVRRRDIFTAVTISMIREFVFTRYLFGMDREQRQKLKSLERLLQDIGPAHAVRQWRAVTLSLLSRRPSFKTQRDQDTEAVVQAIFQALSLVLPPPSNLEDQVQSQLRRVMREAVDLSIEMRTQRADYMMIPPPQPKYDADGEIEETVTFRASFMHERSGDQALPDGETLEAKRANVRFVLFPLVVKKGDDDGIGDDEVVVCPAQVLIASAHRARSRSRTPSKGHRGTPVSEVGGVSLLGRSTAPSNMSMISLGAGGSAGGALVPPSETDLGDS